VGFGFKCGQQRLSSPFDIEYFSRKLLIEEVEIKCSEGERRREKK